MSGAVHFARRLSHELIHIGGSAGLVRHKGRLLCARPASHRETQLWYMLSPPTDECP